jgi:hypothetical protein
MTMTYIVKVFDDGKLHSTMCFNDIADAAHAEETFNQAGTTVVVIPEESDDLSFDECDDRELMS